MKKHYSKKEYQSMVERKSPSSKVLRNTIYAFLIGGTICTIGQCVLSFVKTYDLSEEITGSITSIVMIFIGVTLTGFNIYPKIAKYGGAGTLVPITGFANAVSAPSIESKTEGYVLGVGAKMFTIAGPVILYGCISSFLYGVIYYLIK